MPKRPDVDGWFETYESPMKDVVQALRTVVLEADPRIDECIKWKAPTFTFEGNMASFFPKSKKHASLMFHEGAKIPGKHPLLSGEGDTSRVLKVGSLAEVKQARADIEAIVKAWVAWKERGSEKKAPAKKVAAKKAR